MRPLDATRCVFPYPNDYFTTPGAETPTGRRVFFGGKALPKSGHGRPDVPTRWNETDGFSIGAMVLFSDPNIDLTQTGAAPITDIGPSLDADAPIVMIDAATGERQLIWVERDQRGDTAADQPIIIRVGEDLKENHRYIVALRNMKNGAARMLPAGATFAVYRDSTPTTVLPVEARRPHMEDVLDTLTALASTRSDALPGVGLHDAEQRQRRRAACSPCATTRSTILGTRRAELHGHSVDRAARSRASSARSTAPSRCRST